MTACMSYHRWGCTRRPWAGKLGTTHTLGGVSPMVPVSPVQRTPFACENNTSLSLSRPVALCPPLSVSVSVSISLSPFYFPLLHVHVSYPQRQISAFCSPVLSLRACLSYHFSQSCPRNSEAARSDKDLEILQRNFRLSRQLCS